MIELSQSQYQQLQQKQVQTLAQHQIQSLNILQLARQDLHAHIRMEMTDNPTLEISPGSDDGDGADAAREEELGDQSGFGEQLLGDPVEDGNAPGSANEDLAGAAAERDEFIANLMQIDEGWSDYVPPEHAKAFTSSDDEEKRRFFFDSLTAHQTLADSLLEQLHTTGDCDDELCALGEAVIGNLDEQGYLHTDAEELARLCRTSTERMREAITLVQSFDPPGVAATDLRECLLIQLRRDNRQDSLAYRIIDKHLDDMARNRIPDIARRLRVSNAAVYEAMREVRQLQPRPGNAVSTEPDHYILPEVFVEKSDGASYQVRTNRDSFPRLRISPMYQRLLQNPATPEETKAYLRDKINNVKLLMRSLAQRKSTVHRIAEVIVEKQRDFFDVGAEAMHPLTMSQVAEEIGVHETTVSRAIANKYVQTPRGLFPLKHFFSSGYTTGDGDQLSSLSIKSKLQALIGEENPRRPLSDQKLVALLAEQGLKVARRTVAKYREELGIPSSHLRKSHSA